MNGDPVLLKIVKPVLSKVDSKLGQLLYSSFAQKISCLRDIEECFCSITSEFHEPEQLRCFFHSWSQTNNSAFFVAGLANRITLRANSYDDCSDKLEYFKVSSSLQRIIDEDLGVDGGPIHSDLFYRLATTVCGDDSWQQKKYCTDSAKHFRNSLYLTRVKHPDFLHGLLNTLIHEVYTHTEVEYIYPKYLHWLGESMKMAPEKVRNTLAWVSVHTGGTELNHFGHALDALNRYCEVSGIAADDATATGLFTSYLQDKANVMRELH